MNPARVIAAAAGPQEHLRLVTADVAHPLSRLLTGCRPGHGARIVHADAYTASPRFRLECKGTAITALQFSIVQMAIQYPKGMLQSFHISATLIRKHACPNTP